MKLLKEAKGMGDHDSKHYHW